MSTEAFSSLYIPKRRKSVNSLFIVGTLALIIGALGLSYFLVSLKEEQGELILLVLSSYSGLSFLRMCFYMYGSFSFRALSQEVTDLPEEELPFVSVLVPAYNEAAVIAEVIKNYEIIDYPHFEIIIVDDGSKDQGYEIAREKAMHSPVDIKVYRKENGGKASALNFALEKAQGDYVLCMDADSKLSARTLRAGVRHFKANPNLAAVAGMVKVENKSNFVGGMQYLDYLYGHFQKKVLSVYKKVTIVPGPIGLFRKSHLLEVGGYEKENTTFAEDTELTLKLLSSGKDIILEEEMISYTEAPTNYIDLYRQRYRWTRGIFQAVLKNAHGFLNAKESSYQMIFMYLIWEQVLFPLMDFALLLIFLTCYFFSPLSDSVSLLLLYIYGLDILTTMMATKGEEKRWYWVIQSILARFFYTNVLVVWKISAFFDEWVARGMSWDKLDRTGFTVVAGDKK